jgi:rubrerythrin
MARKLGLHEVVLKMETRMASFYRDASEKASDARIRDVLAFLASEEENHARQFQDLSASVLDVEVLNQAFESTGDMMAFLSGKILKDEILVRKWPSEAEVIRTALDAENDSILFYHALLRLVDDESLSGEIEKVLESEYGHVSDLLKILNMLQQRGTSEG